MGIYNKAILSHRLRRRIRTADAVESCVSNAHHWVIEAPESGVRGSYPLGKCRHCGSVARFSNRLTYRGFNNRKKKEEVAA